MIKLNQMILMFKRLIIKINLEKNQSKIKIIINNSSSLTIRKSKSKRNLLQIIIVLYQRLLHFVQKRVNLQIQKEKVIIHLNLY